MAKRILMTDKTILCIFAHPDDEAFGPGGTIAKLALTNNVYILCATCGDAGQGEKGKKLAEIRTKEIIKSASILGVKKVYFLNFGDGTLNNNLYHKLAERIKEFVIRLQPQILMTFDINGVSGHLDHIAVSLATSYVFIHQKTATELWYYCMHESEENYFKSIGDFDYFVYVPPASKTKDCDKIVDVSKVWDKRIAAMNAHVSQKEDLETISQMLSVLPKKEYFKILRLNR
jgi:LmbE family N-acetylglucosaminyl deacetylase